MLQQIQVTGQTDKLFFTFADWGCSLLPARQQRRQEGFAIKHEGWRRTGLFGWFLDWTDRQSERDLTTFQKRSHIVAFYVKSSTKYNTTHTRTRTHTLTQKCTHTHTHTPHFALTFVSMTDRDRTETWRHNLAASFRPTSHTQRCVFIGQRLEASHPEDPSRSTTAKHLSKI